MAKTVQISRFDGGIAEDLRTTATNECSDSTNFDIYPSPHLLRSFPDQIAETISTGTTLIKDYTITDVIPINFSGTTKLVGWGRASSSDTSASFFTKVSPISTAWAQVVSTTGGGNATPAPGTLVEYKGDAYAITIQPNLIKFTSGTTFTTVGTVGAQNSDNFVCKPFVHPEDNIMYLATNYIIATYDGTTLTTNQLILPSKYTITSLTSYGSYLAIACKPTSGVGRSNVFLWDVAIRPTTVNNSIDWGDGSLEILENLNEVLVGVSAVSTVGTFDTIGNYTYKVKYFAGGAPQIIKDYVVTTTSRLRPHKAKKDDKLYFSFDDERCIFVCGKNRLGSYYVTRDRYITPNGSYIVGAINNFSLVGDVLFTSYTDNSVTGFFTRTVEDSFVSTSTYTTTKNPGMPVSDKTEDKVLKAVQISYRVGLNNGGTTSATMSLSYSSEDSGSSEVILTETKTTNGNFTTPATADANNAPFKNAREYTFYINVTGDCRIKELKYIYEVLKTI